MNEPQASHDVNPEAGKVGLAILMWFLGVPGVIVLLYMIFGR